MQQHSGTDQTSLDGSFGDAQQLRRLSLCRFSVPNHADDIPLVAGQCLDGFVKPSPGVESFRRLVGAGRARIMPCGRLELSVAFAVMASCGAFRTEVVTGQVDQRSADLSRCEAKKLSDRIG